MPVPICPLQIPDSLALYASWFSAVSGHRLIAYCMADPEKCFASAEDEVSTWYARCAVASGSLKSPDKRLKLPVTSKTGRLTDKGSWI